MPNSTPPETLIVSDWHIACDGGGGALGHPRVWLRLPYDIGVVECGYCDRRYVHESVKDHLEAQLELKARAEALAGRARSPSPRPVPQP